MPKSSKAAPAAQAAPSGVVDEAPMPVIKDGPSPKSALRAPNPARANDADVSVAPDPYEQEFHELLHIDGQLDKAVAEWGAAPGGGEVVGGPGLKPPPEGDAARIPGDAAPKDAGSEGTKAATADEKVGTGPISVPATLVVQPPAEPPVPGSAAIADMVRAEAARQREVEDAKAAARAADVRAKQLADQLADIQAKLADNPLEVIKARGWDMESLNRSVVESRTPEAVRVAKLEAELKAMRESQAARDAEAADRAARAEAERSVEAFKDTAMAQLKPLAGSFPATFAFMEEREIRDAMYDVMSQEYQASGGTVRLTPAQAAQRLESRLEPRVTRLRAIGTTPPAPANPGTTPKPTLTNNSNPLTTEADPLDDLNLSVDDLARIGTRMLERARATGGEA